MMLEVVVGDICVRMDDCIEDQRPTPEQTEDYLNRMRRTALKVYRSMPDVAEAAEAAALLDGESEQ